MKHTAWKIALTVSAAVTFGLALAGCSGGSGEAQYDYIVTFDYNVGTLSDTTTIENQYLGVMNKSLIALQPGGNTDFELKRLPGYEVEGWYLAMEYDTDGNPVRDKDERVIVGKKWDFKTDRVTEDTILYANFAKRSGLTILGRSELDGVITEVEIDADAKQKFETRYQGSVGELIYEPSDTFTPTAAGYNFVGYYADAELKTPFEWPCELTEEGVTVYAKFEDTAARVYTAEEFLSAIEANQNIRVMANLDFTDTPWEGNYIYSGTIEGRGHVIKNISCTIESVRDTQSYGLFRRLDSTFKVSDLTFENVTVVFKATVNANFGAGQGYYVSGFADTISRGATLENFAFSGKVIVNKSIATIPVSAQAVSTARGVDLSKITVEVIDNAEPIE